MKFKRVKKIIVVLLVSITVLYLSVPALANAYQKQATLSYIGTKIILDGKAVTLTDSSGNAIEPFIIDGTTYLPVRCVANMVGLNVEWEQNTSTIILTTIPSNENGNDTSGTKSDIDDIPVTGNILNDILNIGNGVTIGSGNSTAGSANKTDKIDAPSESLPVKVTTASELQSYLDTIREEINTPMGDYQYNIKVEQNNYNIYPWDMEIRVQLVRSPWYEIKYGRTYSDADKKETVKILREFQEEIYEIAASYFPDSKLTGCYFFSWYKYPNLKVGYNSSRVLSWRNYSATIPYNYQNSELSSFHWYTDFDDYTFNY